MSSRGRAADGPAARLRGRPAAPAATPIVALDVASASTALETVKLLGDRCSFYKVGSELFTAAGPLFVRELRARGLGVFLDLKLHDIPNTVARAVAVAAEAGVSIVTVHAAGGERMIRAAAAAASGSGCDIFAVTVLTSLEADEVSRVWGREAQDLDLVWEVARLAELARGSGARGVVCSGNEVADLRRDFGSDLALLVPGVRLPTSGADDQSRTVTPAEAVARGADYVVLGRTVTAAPDPVAAMDEAVASMLLAR